jgi:hypothetical protein
VGGECADGTDGAQRLFDPGSSPSANFPMQLILRSFGWPEKAQISWDFPGEPVDRQGCNEGGNRVSEAWMSPDLWTGVI